MRPKAHSIALTMLGFMAGALAMSVFERLPSTQATNELERNGVRAAASSPGHSPAGFADAVAAAAPAVVKVFGYRSQADIFQLAGSPGQQGTPASTANFSATPQRPSRRLGSGVVVSSQGLIVTNGHVVRGLTEIEVELVDGRRAAAALLGIDDATDLAVLRVPLNDLKPIEIGDPSQLRIGDVVLAIGNPYGIGQTVSLGIVSGTGRSQLGLTQIEDFIQTDAAINPGSSGGALVDSSGRLVGIATAGVTESGHSEGLGLAIPSTLVTRVADAFSEHGRLDRGWVGLRGESVTKALETRFGLRSPTGVLVWSIAENSPAESADVRAGDVITAFAGHEIDTASQLRHLITSTRPGSAVTLILWRGSERLELELRTAEWERHANVIDAQPDVTNGVGGQPRGGRQARTEQRAEGYAQPPGCAGGYGC